MFNCHAVKTLLLLGFTILPFSYAAFSQDEKEKRTSVDSLEAKMILYLIDSTNKDIFNYAPLSPKFKSDSASAVNLLPKYPLFPNFSGKALMTPTAFVSRRTFVYAFIGGTYPQVYTHSPDAIGGVGIGFGNALKFISIVSGINVNDVSKLNNISFSLKISRYLSKGTSVSLGGVHLFRNSAKSDFGESYFVVVSHAVQSIPSNAKGYSRLFYSIGAGNGRFFLKSQSDQLNGRGSYGSIVFGNLSYEVIRNLNVNLEWDGLNLDFSAGWRPLPNLPSIMVGVADITRFSGDKLRLIGCIGYAIPVFNK